MSNFKFLQVDRRLGADAAKLDALAAARNVNDALNGSLPAFD
jgi:hypothetical protein